VLQVMKAVVGVDVVVVWWVWGFGASRAQGPRNQGARLLLGMWV